MLRDHADSHARFALRPSGQTADFAAINADGSFGRTQNAGNAAKNGGFSAAIGAENNDQLSRRCGKSYSFQYQAPRGITQRKTPRLDKRRSHSPSLLRSMFSTFTKSRMPS